MSFSKKLTPNDENSSQINYNRFWLLKDDQ